MFKKIFFFLICFGDDYSHWVEPAIKKDLTLQKIKHFWHVKSHLQSHLKLQLLILTAKRVVTHL